MQDFETGDNAELSKQERLLIPAVKLAMVEARRVLTSIPPELAVAGSLAYLLTLANSLFATAIGTAWIYQVGSEVSNESATVACAAVVGSSLEDLSDKLKKAAPELDIEISSVVKERRNEPETE